MDKKIFKCPNHMNVAIKKDGGEVVLDENCCTAMVILLKNDGNMATSFYGYHNEKIIKVMAKAQKKYFKSLKKRLDVESEEDNLVIKSEDIPDDKKWNESKDLPKDGDEKDKEKSPTNKVDGKKEESKTNIKKDSSKKTTSSKKESNKNNKSSTKNEKKQTKTNK